MNRLASSTVFAVVVVAGGACSTPAKYSPPSADSGVATSKDSAIDGRTGNAASGGRDGDITLGGGIDGPDALLDSAADKPETGAIAAPATGGNGTSVSTGGPTGKSARADPSLPALLAQEVWEPSTALEAQPRDPGDSRRPPEAVAVEAAWTPARAGGAQAARVPEA